jgi:hypothetical protein
MALVDVYTPAFWAQQTLLQLFEQQTMIGLCHREFENQVQSQGNIVNTRLPQKFVTNSVSATNPQTTPQIPDSENVQIVLDQWKEVTFEINDYVKSLALKDLVREFIVPAAEAITLDMERAVIGLYADLYNTIGSAGTAPTGVGPLGTDIKQKFDELLIPRMGRNVVLNPTAENNFHKLYYQAYVSGGTETQRNAPLLRKFGLDFYGSTELGTHTKSTGWGTPLVSGANTAGATTLNVKGLTAAAVIKKGDVFTLGSYSYTVTAPTTVAGGGTAALPISPKLQASQVDNDPLTVINTHAINLAFHPQTFALVTRPMEVPSVPGANVTVMNYNGIGIRAARWYNPEKYREYVRLDFLYGVKTLDPRKGFRILG